MKAVPALRRGIGAFLILLLFALPKTLLAQPDGKNSGLPLDRILNSDGTLHPSAGLFGTVDPTGWRMTLAPDGSPRFRRLSQPAQPTGISSDTADIHWDSRFVGPPGVSGDVYAMAVIGTDLYIGGEFSSTDHILAGNIARWNLTSQTWSALGDGVDGVVAALAVIGTDLYVGGRFTQAGGTPANCIAKWNGSAWSTLGTSPNDGTNNTVSALVASGANLYVGGFFNQAGGSTANYIAKWDGSSWSAVGSGVNNRVYALAINGSDLYAGGQFTLAGGNPANHVARWNGSAWLTLGTAPNDGVDNYVYTLVPSSSTLYAGGRFTTAGGSVSANAIAKWNGSSWAALGNGLSGGEAHAIVVDGASVYVVGTFVTSGILTVNGAAVWDTLSQSWSALNQGLVGSAYAFIRNGSDFYAGGPLTAYMNTSTSSPANHVARWSGGMWQALTPSPGNSVGGSIVYALAVSGSDIYIGGNFQTAGPISANNVVKYNSASNTWSSLGTGASNGVDNDVNAIVVNGAGDVFVGGNFTSAGGDPANHVARWNGSAWSTLGTSPSDGTDGYVNALAVNGSNLFVGGSFNLAGGSGANNIARWDGSSWHPLASGVNSIVSAIAIIGSDLFAGGSFNNADGANVNNIARWNGSTWSALGTSPDDGADNNVYALLPIGSTLYVGGAFTHVAGSTIAANAVAAWNGSGWSPLGNGLTSTGGGDVLALASSAGALYAAGDFTASGILSISNIARWDSSGGGSWNPLGSGLSLSGTSIAISGEDVYVGGEFAQAGSKPSYRLARWNPALVATGVEQPPSTPRGFSLDQNYPNPFNPSTRIRYTLPARQYVHLDVYNLLGERVATLTQGWADAGLHEVDFNASGLPSGVYFYRLAAGSASETRKLLLVR